MTLNVSVDSCCAGSTFTSILISLRKLIMTRNLVGRSIWGNWTSKVFSDWNIIKIFAEKLKWSFIWLLCSPYRSCWYDPLSRICFLHRKIHYKVHWSSVLLSASHSKIRLLAPVWKTITERSLLMEDIDETALLIPKTAIPTTAIL